MTFNPPQKRPKNQKSTSSTTKKTTANLPSTLLGIAKNNTSRLVWLDQTRGLGVSLMIAYHFCFDLSWFGWAHFNFKTDWFWLSFRALILTLFLTVAGFTLAHTAQSYGPSKFRHKFWLRTGQLILSALSVSFISWLTFPNSWIYFGILHHLVLASILGRLCLPLGRWNAILALIILITPLGFSTDIFNYPTLNWLGLVTVKPYTEDYVPLFPWFGLVLLGISARWIIPQARPRLLLKGTSMTSRQALKVNILSKMGQHSLLIYLLHQPLLLGLLWLVK